MPTIYFTVTTELSYDQRMIRICTSLANAGYDIMLVGRKKRNAASIIHQPFKQKRLNCWFEKGKLFYAEYNIRLFLFLVFKKMDAVCAIDLDTILPCYYISKIKKVRRIYDAHEYFSQQKEVITRPAIYKFWHSVEKKYFPKFQNGYTVGNYISTEFRKLYGVNYEVIRNIPLLKEYSPPIQKEKIILYQGAVNEARGFEFLIPAMKNIDAVLHIYGDGNFIEQTKRLIETNNLQDKVLLKGRVLPEALAVITRNAYIGINLIENIGLNQFYSLANKFFDFIQNGIPQVTMNFPEYKNINEEFKVALLINDLAIKSIEKAINDLLTDENLYKELQQNCLAARSKLNWQNEEIKLLAFYKNIFG